MGTRLSSSAHPGHHANDPYDFAVPWEIVDSHPAEGLSADTEQHKKRYGHTLRKRSIKHYRHATSRPGAALESFQPLWFAIVISTGGLGLILNGPFPYPAPWQVTLASVLYVFEIALFVVFAALLAARWIVYPHVAVRRALSDADELGSYAIPPIALMTIAALTASQVSTASLGGHAFTVVACVLWWVGVAWVFGTALVVLVVLIYTGNQMDRVMTPVIFMPPVGLATAAAEVAFISINAHGMSARLAVPMLVVGYFAVGIALFMAMILYTMYFHRLLSAGWPAPGQRAALFILIGPAGQLSTAFQQLGESVSGYMRFADYKPHSVNPPMYGTIWRASTAQALDGAGILFALLILGFGYLCLCLAIIGVVDVFVRKQASYSLVWWSIVFPTVTVTTAWSSLGSSMDSPAFRGLSTALFVFFVIVYLANWGFTIWGVVNGQLVWAKSQLEREEEMMKRAQEMEKKSDGHV